MDNERRSEILNKCLSYISDAAPSNKDLYITLSKGIGLSDEEIEELDMEYCLPENENDNDDTIEYAFIENFR